MVRLTTLAIALASVPLTQFQLRAQRPPCLYTGFPRAIQFSQLAGSADVQPSLMVEVRDAKFHPPSFPIQVIVSNTNNGWPIFVKVDSAPGLLTVSLDATIVPRLAPDRMRPSAR